MTRSLGLVAIVLSLLLPACANATSVPAATLAPMQTQRNDVRAPMQLRPDGVRCKPNCYGFITWYPYGVGVKVGGPSKQSRIWYWPGWSPLVFSTNCNSNYVTATAGSTGKRGKGANELDYQIFTFKGLAEGPSSGSGRGIYSCVYFAAPESDPSAEVSLSVDVCTKVKKDGECIGDAARRLDSQLMPFESTALEATSGNK